MLALKVRAQALQMVSQGLLPEPVLSARPIHSATGLAWSHLQRPQSEPWSGGALPSRALAAWQEK